MFQCFFFASVTKSLLVLADFVFRYVSCCILCFAQCTRLCSSNVFLWLVCHGWAVCHSQVYNKQKNSISLRGQFENICERKNLHNNHGVVALASNQVLHRTAHFGMVCLHLSRKRTLHFPTPFLCSPLKFFGITCPSPSLLSALVLCFRAMWERSCELYFSVYIFTCAFVSSTCGICVLVCSAMIISLREDCTASERRERWLRFYWNLAHAHLVISFIKGLKFLYTGSSVASLLLRVFCTGRCHVPCTVSALVVHWCSFWGAKERIF